MGARKSWIVSAALLSLFAAGAGFWAMQAHNVKDVDPDAESKTAADFTFPDLQGKAVSLSNLRGKMVLLDFWATWCGPCIEDIPTLNALQTQFGQQKFTVLGISIDDTSAKEVAAFAREHKLGYPVVLTGGQDKIPDGYNIFGLPTAYLIDASGVIQRKYYGPKSVATVTKDIKDILGHAQS